MKSCLLGDEEQPLIHSREPFGKYKSNFYHSSLKLINCLKK